MIRSYSGQPSPQEVLIRLGRSLAVAAVFIGFIPGCGGEDPSLISLGASGVPVGPESPCGPSVSLNHAKDAVSFVLLLPDHDIASEETIDGVCLLSIGLDSIPDMG